MVRCHCFQLLKPWLLFPLRRDNHAGGGWVTQVSNELDSSIKLAEGWVDIVVVLVPILLGKRVHIVAAWFVKIRIKLR